MNKKQIVLNFLRITPYPHNPNHLISNGQQGRPPSYCILGQIYIALKGPFTWANFSGSYLDGRDAGDLEPVNTDICKKLAQDELGLTLEQTERLIHFNRSHSLPQIVKVLEDMIPDHV